MADEVEQLTRRQLRELREQEEQRTRRGWRGARGHSEQDVPDRRADGPTAVALVDPAGLPQRRERRAERESRGRTWAATRPASSSTMSGPLALLRSPIGLGGLWLLTHTIAAVLFLVRFGTNPDRWGGLIVGELTTTVTRVGQLDKLPPQRVLPELTGPNVRLLQGLADLVGNTGTALLVALAVIAVLADVLVLVLLMRAATNGPTAAAYWALAVPLLGPVAYARLDMLTVATVVLAWVWASRRPLWAGAALAVATGLQTWPVLVVLPLMAAIPGHRRRAAAVGYAALGLPLVVVGLLTGGWTRLLSPFTSIGNLGLGVDSVLGTAPLLDVAVGGRHSVTSASGVLELRGSWVAGLLTTSVVLGVLVVVVSLVLGALLLRASAARAHPEAATPESGLAGDGALVVAASLLACLTVGRSLSAEALVWALPFLAMVAGRRGRRPWLVLLVLFAVLLTQWIYPYSFGQLAIPSSPGFDRSAILVAVRNLALVVAVAWAVFAAARAVWVSPRPAPATVPMAATRHTGAAAGPTP